MAELLTTQLERHSAAWAGEGLAEHFQAGQWDNDFVARLAKDAIGLRDQVEALTAALRDTAMHFHLAHKHTGLTIGAWSDCPHPVCAAARKLLEGKTVEELARAEEELKQLREWKAKVLEIAKTYSGCDVILRYVEGEKGSE